MWNDLSLPWQACLELAWEAYCDDCYPIGAVVTDAGGIVLSRGRNRIYPRWTWKERPSHGVELAHAEVEALQRLDYSSIDQHTCALYTTTEPCPMCMGTFYMSGVRTLHYAARDPWAGSTNILGKTPYLARKPIKVHEAEEPVLAMIVVGLFVEQDCSFHDGKLPEGNFYRCLMEEQGEAVAFGQRLSEMGEVRRLREKGASVKEMVNRLAFLVK